MKKINYPIHNLKGEEVGKVDLDVTVFNVTAHPHLIQQAAQVFLANLRQPIAHTKTKAEVAKSGRKPWRQKGTGRARAGSFASPLFRGGGTIFGPRSNRQFAQKLPHKMKIKATLAALSDFVKEKTLVVVSELKLNQPKTQEIAKIISRLPLKEKKILLISTDNNPIIQLAGRNLPYLTIKDAANFNFLDLMNHGNLLMNKKAVAAVVKRFKNSKEKQEKIEVKKDD